jgi:acetyl esterase/lipase
MSMSQPVSRFLHPFDVARHPSLEPEVKRAILARWASDRSAVAGQPALRKPPGMRRAVAIDDVLAALRSLDGETRPDRARSQ